MWRTSFRSIYVASKARIYASLSGSLEFSSCVSDATDIDAAALSPPERLSFLATDECSWCRFFFFLRILRHPPLLTPPCW